MSVDVSEALNRIKALRERAGSTINSTRRIVTGRRRSKQRTRQPQNGCGSILKERLTEWKIPGCIGCIGTAKKMNRLGPSGCAEKRDELIEEILPRARKWVERDGAFGGKVLERIKSLPGGSLFAKAEDAALRLAIGKLLIDYAISEAVSRQKKTAVDVMMVIAHGVGQWHERQTGFDALCAANGIRSTTVYMEQEIRQLEEAVRDWMPKICVIRAILFDGDDLYGIAERFPATQFVLVCQSLPSHLLTWDGTLDKFTACLLLSQTMPNVWLATPDEREPWRGLTPRSLWWPNCSADVPMVDTGPIVGPIDLSLVGRKDLVKSFPNQIMAAAIANKTRRCRLHVMVRDNPRDLCELAVACGLEVFTHAWKDHDAHRQRIGALIDIGLQAGFCESWNYVALEHLLAGKPVVGSSTIRFLTPDMVADPNDVHGMAAMILRLAERIDSDPQAERRRFRDVGERAMNVVNLEVVAMLRRMLQSDNFAVPVQSPDGQ